MKRKSSISLIVYLCAASSLFVGCDKEMPTQTDVKAIGFNTETMTRGGIQNTDNLSGFGVFTYYHATGGFDNAASSPDYMYNIPVQRHGSDWIYSPLRYWPVDGSLSFFAYAPHSSASGGSLEISPQNNAGLPILSYAVPDDVARQLDLLAAAPVYASTDRGERVHFDFDHVLARINFDARLTAALPAGWSAQIKSIQIEGFNNKGTYRFDSWTVAGDAVKKSYTLSTTNSLLENITLNTSFQAVSADNAHLMMIPQGIDALDVIIITVTFNKNGTLEDKTFTHPLREIITNLEGAKAYNVKLSLNSLITFDLICEVSNWTTYTITLPPFS